MRLIPYIAAMAVIVVASNILVQFLLWGGLLTWGAFSYPLASLVTDLANRLHGPAAARRVVYAGLVTGIVCSLIGTQVMLEFGPAVTLRVAVASALAFLASSLLDVAVFNRLRAGRWWTAPFVSTLLASILDTAIFFSVAFAGFVTLFPAAANEAVIWAQGPAPLLNLGPEAPLWLSLAVADWGVKLAVAVLALIPFRLGVGHLLRTRTI